MARTGHLGAAETGGTPPFGAHPVGGHAPHRYFGLSVDFIA